MYEPLIASNSDTDPEHDSDSKIIFSFYSYTVFLRASLLPYSAL